MDSYITILDPKDSEKTSIYPSLDFLREVQDKTQQHLMIY